ncbi:DNA-processing protein DprA [Mycoplasma enhydrae]|uniref:DNA-processing protein DprA n=1 Tax=Mycoplasma enhydrae TaxID=2499220 RepID=UPI0021E78B19|nr:DNA-processing protein DprA [Mycoplasma enhydrae]MCV3733483.1 DNA-processing protein DprA [Mycoplasma enhydrae]MCV3753269.1 DNA-processing protein DprA [Mycoplasma enhydrae]
MADMNEILLYFNYKYKGDWNRIYEAIKTKEKIEVDEFKSFSDKSKSNMNKYISILDGDYPQQLLAHKKPPFILHYLGNLDILTNSTNKIYMTGSYQTNEIIKYIDNISNKSNVTFMNMYWNGLEQNILKKLIEKNINVIVVLPCGINWAISNLNLNEYIAENCLFISEYPDDYHATKKSYLARNRISAGLCNKMILLSSLEYKYNTLIDNFLDYGKDIQCLLFKDRLEADKNIELINQGAELISENCPI